MFNKLLLIFLFVFIYSCTAQKKITAKKDQDGYLIGTVNKASFQDPSYKIWFDDYYETYTTDKTTISKLASALKGYEITGFIGSWCWQSQRDVPRLYKILEEAGFDMDKLELLGIDRSKTDENNRDKGLEIIRVPTFIFYKDGKEVGRYVENPREYLEKDFLKIVTGQPYKHSYIKD